MVAQNLSYRRRRQKTLHVGIGCFEKLLTMGFKSLVFAWKGQRNINTNNVGISAKNFCSTKYYLQFKYI